jgi:hypothetical protein
MKDIPADGIYYDDALIIVAQMLNPDTWQILEKRLNRATPGLAFQEPDAKAGAVQETERTYYDALRLADERLQEKISQGTLVALRLDPVTGKERRLHRHASMGDFITRITDHLAGTRQPYFFNRESFDNAVKEIAQPTTGRVENPEQTRPTELELLEPKAWLDRARKENPKQRNERPTAYIRRLHGLMQKADNVTKPWKAESTVRVRYYEALKTDQQTVQKKRKSPRTV